jgi:hypothetical protein
MQFLSFLPEILGRKVLKYFGLEQIMEEGFIIHLVS